MEGESNQKYSHHGGNFGSYFRQKQEKLALQDDNGYSKKSNIFANCKVYINGNTNPPAIILKKLIIENGGEICAFLGRKSSATHIMATHLTNQKIKDFANHRVVLPEWVTESVKLGVLQDWTKFRTIKIESCFNVPSDKVLVVPKQDPAALNMNIIDSPGTKGDKVRIEWILNHRLKINCLNKSFISDYFNQSRLHFMSTRKLQLRRKCRTYQPPLFPTQGSERTLIHVDYDSFFVSASLRSRPDLSDQPVCVSNGSAGSDIASANYKAREYGVSNGMWVGKAKQLCPNLICLPFDFTEYAKCSDILYDTLLALNPLRISAISLDEALVDISNMADEAETVSQEIRRSIKDQAGIEVSIGIGSNILLARLALKKAKPKGQCVLSPEQVGEFNIRDLPGVGRQVQQKLDKLGIEKVSDLKNVPLSKLNSAVGNALSRKLHEYAYGKDTDDIRTLDTPIKTVGIEIGWAIRLISNEEVAQFVFNCCEELFSRLNAVNAYCEMITVKQYRKMSDAPFVAPKHLGHGHCDIASKTKKVNNKLTFEELVEDVMFLIQQLNCPPLEFRGIGLHMQVKEVESEIESREEPARKPFQSRIKFSTTKLPPPVTPTKQVLPSILPKPPPPKKRYTVTQLFQDAHDASYTSQPSLNARILSELPSQTRRQILLNEDDYLPSLSAPFLPLVTTDFLGKTSLSELRKLLKKWIDSCAAPTSNDARRFFNFIRLSITEDTLWARAAKLVDWIKVLAKDKPEWLYYHSLLYEETQKQLLAKNKATKLF